MAGDDDDALFRSREFGDDVMNGKLPLGRVGGECILFDSVVLEMGKDVVFNFLVIGAATGPRPEGDYLFHILHCARAVYGGRRPAVWRQGRFWRLGRCDGSGALGSYLTG